MIWYNCKPQYIIEETLNLPHLEVLNFRCAYALLFYPSNGFWVGDSSNFFGFLSHYHLLHMGTKLWYQGLPI
jgi:hypothetical protein